MAVFRVRRQTFSLCWSLQQTVVLYVVGDVSEDVSASIPRRNDGGKENGLMERNNLHDSEDEGNLIFRRLRIYLPNGTSHLINSGFTRKFLFLHSYDGRRWIRRRQFLSCVWRHFQRQVSLIAKFLYLHDIFQLATCSSDYFIHFAVTGDSEMIWLSVELRTPVSLFEISTFRDHPF